MTRKWMWAAALTCGMTLAGAPAVAQEMSFRSGVITAITPMQVEAAAAQQQAPSRTGGAIGRALGRAAGRAAARVTGDYSYETYEIANSTAQDLAGTVAAAPAGVRTITAYMVMLKFDDGNESAIRAASADSLRVGARARVFGTGSNAQIVAE